MTRWEDFKESLFLAAGAIAGGIILTGVAVVKFIFPRWFKM